MKHVAVTGAGGGLGKWLCMEFRAAQWQVLELSHRDGWDVTNMSLIPWHWLRGETFARISECADKCPNIDALVCCHAAPVGYNFESVIAVDLIGAYNACMAVLPGMVARQWGRIVLLGSIRANAPRPGQIAYAAAKAGVEGLCKGLANQYRKCGITCNVVAPGAVITERTKTNIANGTVSESELVARTPAGRLCTPADVAAAVVWLVSDGAAMINGQTVVVDGGWSVSG